MCYCLYYLSCFGSTKKHRLYIGVKDDNFGLVRDRFGLPESNMARVNDLKIKDAAFAFVI